MEKTEHKRFKKNMASAALALVLAFSAASPAMAMEIPISVTTAELNGQQILTEVYQAGQEIDPESLIKDDFTKGEFIYSYDNITKEETESIEKKIVTQTVEMQSNTKDLSKNIDLFAATIEYTDEDGFTGTLNFDPKSVKTEVNGYRTKHSTVTDTKTYDGLPYNDPTLIPQSVEKNGHQLSVSDIQWQEETLAENGSIPTSYKAVVTYSKSLSSSVASGYTVTAEYTGEVAKNGQSDIVYTITYTGLPVPEPEPEMPETPEEPEGMGAGQAALITAGAILGSLSLAGAAYACTRKSRKNKSVPASEDTENPEDETHQ